MSVPSVLRPASGLRDRLRAAAPRESLDALSRLLGLTEPRIDREAGPLTIRVGVPGEATLAVIDRREGAARTYRFEADAEDLADRLAAIGGRPGLSVRILVDPAACFMRTLTLPVAALPRMRAVLAQELEATTPFRAEGVHSDWYVEGEDAEARTLRVRHVVLKRARLAALFEALGRAGMSAGAIVVGTVEERTMPLDLLSGGHRALPGFLRGAGTGNLVLLAGAALMLLAAFQGVRAHQAATLATLDDAFLAARRAAGPPAAAAISAGTAAILAARGPALAQAWDAIAATLPDTASATGLRYDAGGIVLTLVAPDEAAALASLAAVSGFGAPVLREAAAGDGGRRLVVALPRLPVRGQP